MTAEEMKELIAAEAWDELESAWVEAIEEGADDDEMAGVLEALVAADQLDRAETLGWTLLEQRAEDLPPAEALDVARAVVSAVPISDELRGNAADLYRAVHAGAEHLQAILTASGLAEGQSPRRAFRTLDVCLGLRDGGYVVNRFDNQVLRAERFDAAAGEFELADAAGRTVRMEPKALADEFDLAEASDFRVLHQHRPSELPELLQSDPAAVLIGLCQARGRQTDAAAVKSELAGRHLPADKWSSWWNRARAAAKRCPHLALEGRNPVQIVYYPRGRSLEEELSQAAAAARTPLARLAVLEQYARELKQRKLPVDAGFAGPLVASLARRARSLARSRPGAALTASLAAAAAIEMGMPAPAEPFPPAGEILAAADAPARAIAALSNPALWPAALEALAGRDDPAEQLAELLYLAPAGQLDAIASRLDAAGAAHTVEEAVAAAMADPAEHVEVLLWLWSGPASPPANAPIKVEQLSRLLELAGKLTHDIQTDPDRRRNVLHRIRAAVAARDYASYRQAVEQMDQAVAETFRNRIDRGAGLAETLHDEMISILRQKFYGLFLSAAVEPWLDENALWTTPEALQRRKEMLKEILEVKIPENERAVGAAAAHGDLSENSEWKFALEERDLLRARMAKLEGELARARLLRPEDVPTDTVGIGSKVQVRRLSDGAELELTFLGAWDSDPQQRIYSYKTALAAECMGKKPGETFSLKIEDVAGEYRIESIASALPGEARAGSE